MYPRIVMFVAILALVVGCKSDPPPEPVGEPEERTTPTPEGGPTPVTPSFDLMSHKGLAVLPPETFTLMAVESIDSFASFMGSKELTERSDWLPLLFTQRMLYFGLNPFNKTQMQGLGLATNEPAMLAALTPDWMTFAAIATTSDGKVFAEGIQKFIETELNGTVTVSQMNGWTVLDADGMAGAFGRINRYHTLIRGELVVTIISGLSAMESERWATVLTHVDPKVSMAHLPGLKRGVERLGPEHQAFVYVNIAALTGQYLVGFESMSPTGTTPKDVDNTRQNPESMAVDDRKRSVHIPIFEGTRYAELLALLMPIDGIAAGATLDTRGMKSRLEVVARDTSLTDKLLKNSNGRPLIMAAHNTAPLFLVHTQADIPTLRMLLEAMLGPGALNQANRMSQDVTGKKLDDELLPLLDGEIGLAVSGDLADMPHDALSSMSVADDHLRFVSVLGLLDPDAAVKVIESSISNPLTRLLINWDAQRKVLSIPIIGFATLTLAVHERYLVISNDRSMVDRIIEGDLESWVEDPTLPEALQPVMLRDGPAAALWLDMKVLALFSGIALYGARPLGLPDPPARLEDAPPEWDEYVTRYRSARALVRKNQLALLEHWYQLHVEVLGRFGAFGASAHMGKDGLVIDGAFVVEAESVGQLLDEVTPKVVTGTEESKGLRTSLNASIDAAMMIYQTLR